MNNMVLINTGNINSKELITDNKIKSIKETEQLQSNKLKIRVSNNNNNK